MFALNISNMPSVTETGINEYLNDKLAEKGIKKPEELDDAVLSTQSNQFATENEIVLGQKNLIVVSFDGVPDQALPRP